MLKEIQNRKEEILKKKFKKDFKAGYDAYEVDKFFDSVITFLDYVGNEYASIYNQNQKLIEKNIKIENKLEKYNTKISLLEKELNELKDSGYQNQKIIKDISSIQTDIEKIKNENK